MFDSPEPAVRLIEAVAGGKDFELGPLSVGIPEGCVTAVVGPNGSGKSTLFRILLGLQPLRSGAAEVLGAAVEPGGEGGYKAEIGFLPEIPQSYENSMTVARKAEFASLWYPGWKDASYRRLLERFGVEERTKLSKLSKGNRRKAELAVAMAHGPRLLMLDEPSSGLDPFAWKIMLEELQAYMEPGDRTLILTTHITEEVNRLADYVLILHRGRCLGLHEKDRLLDEWQTVRVRRTDTAADARELHHLPGFCGLTDEGSGIYRLEMNASDFGAVEEDLSAYGFQLLESRRMELEDILSCMIQKEEDER